MLGKPKPKNQDFADVVKEFMERDRNNEIVVEVLDMAMNDLFGNATLGKDKNNNNNKKQEKGIVENTVSLKTDIKAVNAKDNKKQGKIKNSITTDYIIDGDTQVVVNVVKDPAKK
jgi:hypothetical protein